MLYSHRDIQDWTVKVADFGSGRLLDHHKHSAPRRTVRNPQGRVSKGTTAESTPGDRHLTKHVGSPLWRAPEVYAGSTQYGPGAFGSFYPFLYYRRSARLHPWTSRPPVGASIPLVHASQAHLVAWCVKQKASVHMFWICRD